MLAWIQTHCERTRKDFCRLNEEALSSGIILPRHVVMKFCSELPRKFSQHWNIDVQCFIYFLKVKVNKKFPTILNLGTWLINNCHKFTESLVIILEYIRSY